MLSFKLISLLLHLLPSFLPSFAEKENLDEDSPIYKRVPLGSDTTLPCSGFENPSSAISFPKMRWVRTDDKSVLSVDDKIIARNDRLSVSKGNFWYELHIRQVKESDRGCYICESKSNPRQQKKICIDVLVSPYIEETSDDVIIEEGGTVWLECKARGHPQPRISWKREDHQLINHGYISNGSVLVIDHVKKEESGAYLCIASNDVPPTVSKRVLITVNFKPVVGVEKGRVGCEEGQDVRLVCNCYASPTPQISWIFNNNLISHSLKYNVDREESGDFVSSGLRLRSVASSDFGFYTCVCSNTMGRRVTSLNLYRMTLTTSRSEYLPKKPIWSKDSDLNDEDIAVTEMIGNALGSMTSAKATSIQVTSIESLSKNSYKDNSSSSTVHHLLIFFYVLILITIC